MAEDFRDDDPNRCEVISTRLIAECRREEANCLDTSTSFFIWLRWLKGFRAALWAGAAVSSALAASHILSGDPAFRVTMAFAALAGVLLPAIGRALRLDAAIHDYAVAAARFKNLQGEFRRAAEVWSLKPVAELEVEARRLFKVMADARKPSLTPPEFLFWMAQRKIRKGHYSYDVDKNSTGGDGNKSHMGVHRFSYARGPASGRHNREFGKNREVGGVEGIDSLDVVGLHGGDDLQVEDVAAGHRDGGGASPAARQPHAPGKAAHGEKRGGWQSRP
jgi:hypothetical protein